ncbi:methyltransferase domain-containing protein [Egibacter rhizosphaerae]|uniref:Methyltransferase domain-containing protein n=1 Tax=Egibacter rhizosphaerae TaxID=1670831 RepID=A0A411YB53_9ACTN|nr:class I SAM-dependent methyltransferase [Egibacter rhizosphaerae]QBI18415.1 methyltransferase domain-containing protein [Egibacter rhizosphaerae]
MTATASAALTVAEQAKPLLAHAAGYASHRTISLGLRTGLVEALAHEPDGLSPEGLARRLGLDGFYVAVWCRSALAAGVCERDGERYRLAPHVATLLLDMDSPAYIGGVFLVFEQHEMFDRFEAALPSGERLWWDDCGPEWIAGVAGTGTPFYTRLVGSGLGQVSGLDERLADGGRIVDTACGSGEGLLRLAEAYPTCEIVGVDGDAYSVSLARDRVAEAGLSERVSVHVSPLEDLVLDDPAALVVNNISMHECRDLDRTTERVLGTLEPGGWFVISDFPFPETDEGLASVPGRIMGGIQFFEAQIDDQLLPRSAYDELLSRHGFVDLGSTELTPVHALTWGRRA